MSIPAPINSSARLAYAQVLRQFISGRMTNYEYESKYYKIYKKQGQDAGGDAIYDAAWYLYCDLRKHRMTDAAHAPTPDFRRVVARWVLFLRTTEPPPVLPGVVEGHRPVRGGPMLMVSVPLWLLSLVVYGNESLLGGAVFGILAMAMTISGVVKLGRPTSPVPEPSCPAFELTSAWPFSSAEVLAQARSSPTYLAGFPSQD